MEQRIAWNDLPRRVRDAIEDRTGPITGVRIPGLGQNSPLAGIIDTSAGRAFVKGMPSDHRKVIAQEREAAVAPFVAGISSVLLWSFDLAGWSVLDYEYAAGRHADYTPGSPDLDRLVQLMTALTAISVPRNPGPFKPAEDRWKGYVDDPAMARVFAGATLTHSDWTPDNVLVSGHRAWLIDWAWPTLGAPWTDPAGWLLRLMASGGHTPRRPSSRQRAANPAHIDLFAAANVRLWDEIASSSNSDWPAAMVQAAHDWHAYRHAVRWAAQDCQSAPARPRPPLASWPTVRRSGPSASPSADQGACQGGRPARWGTRRSRQL